MKKHNILVISNEQEALQNIKKTLEEDYNILTCEQLEKAKEIEKNNNIHLIITDLKANEIVVFNYLERNKGQEHEPGAMVVLTESTDTRRLLDGVNGQKLLRYVLKPWDPTSLRLAVKNVLETYTLITENKQLAEKIKESFSMTLIMLATAMEARDTFAQGHSERVGYASKCIARRMNIPEKDLEMLYSACLLHDIGKIGVPENILNKTDRLDEDEMIYIKAHTSIAERILAPDPDFAEMIPYIRSHHERVDGKGYPDGLKGEQIPLFSRIIAVADTFDAITSNRPYRPGKSFEIAIKILEESKDTQLDAKIVDIFIEMLRERPISSLWELE